MQNNMRDIKQGVLGEGNLEALAEAPEFNKWMYDSIAPFVGSCIMEIGAGLGNITEWIQGDRIIVTDYADFYLDRLKLKFSNNSNINICKYDLSDSNTEYFENQNIDTIICLNVLEHLENDNLALQNIFNILSPGGTLILLVPYSKKLYCQYDRHVAHFRRYGRQELIELVAKSGFFVEKNFLFNLFGGISWFISGKIFKRKQLNPGSVRLFGKLVPLFKIIEMFGTPFGASIVCIAKKGNL